MKADTLAGRLNIGGRKLMTAIAKFAIGRPMPECVVQIFSWIVVEADLPLADWTDSYWWWDSHMILSMTRANP